MKKLLFLLVLMMGVAGCFAQADFVSRYPGYMGRRVLFNMEMSMAPGLKRVPNFQGDKRYWAFNYLLQPNVEVIAWRSGTVGAKFIWFDTKFDTYDEWTYDYVTRDLRVMGGGVFCKVYLGRGATAPLGQFLRFHFDYMRALYDVPASGGDYTYREGKNCYGFRLEYGRDFFFCDFLKLNIGMSAGLSFPGIYFFKYAEDMEVGQRAANRVVWNYFFGVNIGVGFLTF